MADNAIGPLSIKAVVNPEGVMKGIDDAKKALDAAAKELARPAEKAGDAWAKSFRDRMTGGLGSLRDWGQGLGNLFERGLGNPARLAADSVGFLGSKIEKLPAIGPLLSLPFEGLAGGMTAVLDTYDKGSKKVLDLGAAAQRANMDLRSFQGLAAAMGEDLEGAAKASVKFREALTNAFLAGPGGRNAFRDLGLDPAALVRDSGAFDKFAASVRGVNNQFLQTRYAIDVFGGKLAGSVMPLLTGDKLDKFRGLIDAFGAGVSGKDFGNVKAAAEAAKQFAFLKEGFTNQVTIGVAPILAELAAWVPKLDKLGISFKGLAQGIVDGFLAFGEVVAGWADNPEKVWGDVKGWFHESFVWVEQMIVKTLSGAIRAGVEAGLAVGPHWLRGMTMVGLQVFGDQRDLQAVGAAQQARARRELARQGEDWGAVGVGVARHFGVAGLMGFGPEKLGGASAAFQTFASGVQARMRGIKQAARDNNPFELWLKAADELKAANRSPVEKFREDMLKVADIRKGLREGMAAGYAGQGLGVVPGLGPLLGKAAAPGLGGLFGGFFGASAREMLGGADVQAEAKAIREFASASKGKFELPAAMLQGSAAAASTINYAKHDPGTSLPDLMKQNNEQNKQLAELVKTVVDELRKDPAMGLFLRGN